MAAEQEQHSSGTLSNRERHCCRPLQSYEPWPRASVGICHSGRRNGL